MNSWREVLGVTTENTLATLRQKYRKLALERHPNKPTGNTVAFQRLQNAWEKAQRHFAGSSAPRPSTSRPAPRPTSRPAPRPTSSTKKKNSTYGTAHTTRRRYTDPTKFKKRKNNYFQEKEAREAEYRRRAITHMIGVVQPDKEVRTFDFLTVRTTQRIRDVFATVVKHAAQIKAAGAGDVMKGFRVAFGKRVTGGTIGPYDIVLQDYDKPPGPNQHRTLAGLAGNLDDIPNIFVRISLWREYVPNPKIPPYMRNPPQWYVPNAAA